MMQSDASVLQALTEMIDQHYAKQDNKPQWRAVRFSVEEIAAHMRADDDEVPKIRRKLGVLADEGVIQGETNNRRRYFTTWAEKERAAQFSRDEEDADALKDAGSKAELRRRVEGNVETLKRFVTEWLGIDPRPGLLDRMSHMLNGAIEDAYKFADKK